MIFRVSEILQDVWHSYSNINERKRELLGKLCPCPSCQLLQFECSVTTFLEGRDPYIPDTGCTQDSVQTPYRSRTDAVRTPYGRRTDVRRMYAPDIVRISYGYRTDMGISYGYSTDMARISFERSKSLPRLFHCTPNRTASPGMQMNMNGGW